MKKIYGLIGLGMLTFVLFFSMVSAIITINPIGKLDQNGGSFNLILENNNNTVNETNVNVTIYDIEQTNGKIWFKLNNTQNTKIVDVNQTTVIINVTYGIEDGFEFEYGKDYSKDYTTELLVDGVNRKDLIFEEDFCEGMDNINNKLKLNIKDIKVEGFGDEDVYWYLRDVIEVEIEVENDDNDWEFKDVEIEWELYATNGEKIDDGKVSDFNLKDGDTETIIFEFKLDEDIEEFDGEDAALYVKATARIDSDDDNDGEDTCEYVREDVSVRTDDFVIVDNIKINDESAKTDEYNTLDCEKEVTVSFEVWNIGDDEEEDLYVEVYSKNLEVYEKFEITSINEFDSSEVFEFKFTVPADLDEGKYNLEFEVYDDDNDIYEDDEEDESRTIIRFENEESCLIVQPYVTATLDSEAKEGNDMIIKVIVRNDDVQSRTFSISAEDYSDWAKLKDVSSESFILESGQNQEILITFEIKDEIVGNKDFNLNIFSDGKLISTQPVAVTIEAKKGLSDLFDDVNWKLVGIILVNLILLIAIIVVVRKILKKK